ncbi:MAG TPA: Dynamin family protein, partial [Candidatus Acetothermia bacterium]|nr:Dynamin family protein [Candidatus Acetothermia bacterium]
SVVPLTAIPTFIRNGERLSARVQFQNGQDQQWAQVETSDQLREFLTEYVTEEGNPNNEREVTQVEVFYPSSLLNQGVVLIDTPGIGSTFRHNTEATLNFLPQCDAALFLVSADPPITEVEVKFLRQVRSKVSRLFFILNKVDYLDNRDRRAALNFLRTVLTEQANLPADASIFCVSARQGVASQVEGNDALWETSGMAELERHLVKFLVDEKAAALREALGRKAADALAEAAMRLRLALRSLEMPLHDLQQRLAKLETKIREARRQRETTGDMLAGDRRRMHEFLEQTSEQLREKASEYLRGIVQETLARNGQAGEDEVKNALAEAIPGYFEHQVGQTTELFTKRTAETLKPHQQRADELIESVRKTAAELFNVPYHAPDSARAFEMVHRPYWVKHKWASSLIPIPSGLVDRSLPASIQRKRIRKRLLEQVDNLVVANVENLRWATFQSIDQTFSQFASTLDRRLAETVDATHGAIHAAMERRQSHSDAIASEVAQIGTATMELEQLRADLNSAIAGSRAGDTHERA